MPTDLGFTAAPAVRDGRVYIGDNEGCFYCVVGRSGEVKWRYKTGYRINASANFGDDCVIFGSQDFNLYCLRTATGEVAWKYETGDEVWSFPAVRDGRVYAACCDAQLHVIDLARGTATARIDLTWPTCCAAAMLGETVFVGSDDDLLMAVDPVKRRVLWRHEEKNNAIVFLSCAAVTPEAVIIGGRDKAIHALEPKSGRPLWRFSTRGRVDSSPVIVGQRVFVGSGDGRVYGLDLKSGKEVWRFNAGAAVLASPAVAAGRLVIGAEDGNLYCFGAKIIYVARDRYYLRGVPARRGGRAGGAVRCRRARGAAVERPGARRAGPPAAAARRRRRDRPGPALSRAAYWLLRAHGINGRAGQVSPSPLPGEGPGVRASCGQKVNRPRRGPSGAWTSANSATPSRWRRRSRGFSPSAARPPAPGAWKCWKRRHPACRGGIR